MKKLLLLLLFAPLVSLGQKTIIKNNVNVISPIGYSYDSNLSTNDKAHYVSDNKEELLVYVYKINEFVSEGMIDKILLSENTSIKWKLFDGPSGDKWSTISYGIQGVYGYRTAFKLDGKLVLIQSFALSYNEALKTVLKASNDIQSKN